MYFKRGGQYCPPRLALGASTEIFRMLPSPQTGEDWDGGAEPNDLNLASPWAILYLATEHKEA